MGWGLVVVVVVREPVVVCMPVARVLARVAGRVRMRGRRRVSRCMVVEMFGALFGIFGGTFVMWVDIDPDWWVNEIIYMLI